MIIAWMGVARASDWLVWLVATVGPLVPLTALTIFLTFRANRRMNARVAEREATGCDPREARSTFDMGAELEGTLSVVRDALAGLKLKYGTSVHLESGPVLRCHLAADWRSMGQEVLVQVMASDGGSHIVVRSWPSSDWQSIDWGRSREVVETICSRILDTARVEDPGVRPSE